MVSVPDFGAESEEPESEKQKPKVQQKRMRISTEIFNFLPHFPLSEECLKLNYTFNIFKLFDGFSNGTFSRLFERSLKQSPELSPERALFPVDSNSRSVLIKSEYIYELN